MAHTYVVTSNSFIPGPLDPQVTIVGSVDGIPVTITVWKSAYDSARLSGGIPALEALVAPLMLAQSIINSPPPPQAPVNQVTGTFVL